MQYRFPVLISGILGGLFAFYFSFSNVNHDRIKIGSRRFTDTPPLPQQTQKSIPADE